MKWEIYGIKAWTLAVLLAIIGAAQYLGVLSADLVGAMALFLAIGFVSGYIGDNLPIWKDFIGGGSIMAYFFGALIVKYGLLPEETIKLGQTFIGKWNYLNLFIAALITGSVLSVDRKLLIRAVSGYIPAILAGIVGAAVFGIGAGFLVGIDYKKILCEYVMPIMGGGVGAGALPLSDMYAAVTGADKKEFLSVAMPILTMGNIFAILFGALSVSLGKLFPSLSGEGDLVKGGKEFSTGTPIEEEKPTLDEIGIGFLVIFALYFFSVIISKKVLPKIFGVGIHPFAYMVFFAFLCNICNVFSRKTVAGLRILQKFFAGPLLMLLMLTAGMAYLNLNAVIAALTWQNMFVSFAIVLGCYVFCGAFAMLIGFYPIETAITAGLCMANTGGTGDVAVLGAAKRMNLMSFAQISSRIGGGIVLLIASACFALFMK